MIFPNLKDSKKRSDLIVYIATSEQASLEHTSMLGSTILRLIDLYEYQVAIGRLFRSLGRMHSASVVPLLTIMSLACGTLLVSGCSQQNPSAPFFTPGGVISMTAPSPPAPGLQQRADDLMASTAALQPYWPVQAGVLERKGSRVLKYAETLRDGRDFGAGSTPEAGCKCTLANNGS
jgi:hypothetical protein